VILLKAALLSNKQTLFYVNRVTTLLPSQSDINRLSKEISNHIEEIKLTIGLYLLKIIDVSKKEIKLHIDRFHFSTYDLEKGYVFLYKWTLNKEGKYEITNFIEGVLLLGECPYEKNDEFKFEKGGIYDFVVIKPYLSRVKGVLPRNNSIMFAIKKINKYEKSNS